MKMKRRKIQIIGIVIIWFYYASILATDSLRVVK